MDLHNNWELRQLPESIRNCKELRYLDISDTELWNIPDEIFELKKLEHLDFSYRDDGDGSMTSLSPKIGNLTNLKWFALTGKFDLKTLPSQIGDLKNLETLILEYNGLTSLPKEIGKLENLVHLNLRGCELEILPPEIANLNNLETLHILDNEFENIPKEILHLFEKKFEATNKSVNESVSPLIINYLLAYKNRVKLTDNQIGSITEKIQSEEQKLNNPRSSLKEIKTVSSYISSTSESV